MFFNAETAGDVLEAGREKADIISVNYHTPMIFDSRKGIPPCLRAAREISRKRAVLLHGKLIIEEEKHLSTLVLKDGELSGVSDCMKYEPNRRGTLRMYNFFGVKLGVVSDADLLPSGADNLFFCGARGILHNTLSGINKEYYGCLKGHLRLTDGVYLSVCGDGALYARRDGNREKVELLEIGKVYDIDWKNEPIGNTNGFLRISYEG